MGIATPDKWKMTEKEIRGGKKKKDSMETRGRVRGKVDLRGRRGAGAR